MRQRFIVALAASSLLLVAASPPPSTPDVTFTVDSLADTPDLDVTDGTCEDAGGSCTLRAAIDQASYSSTFDGLSSAIEFAVAGTVLVGSVLDADGAVTTVEGAGITLDGGDQTRILDVRNGARVQLNDLVLRDGAAVGNGGAIRAVGGFLGLSSVTISDSSAAGVTASGGGVATSGTDLLVEDSSITDNQAVRAGGGIEIEGGSATIVRTTIRGNDGGSAPGNGGGVHVTGPATTTFRDGVVEANTAQEGGGLWNSSTGVMNVRGTKIDRNEALGTASDTGGGGLFSDGGLLDVRDAMVVNNTASQGSGSGGGVMSLGRVSFNNVLVAGNTAARAGGGFELTNSSAGASPVTSNLVGITLERNTTGTSPGNGGALHITHPHNLRISASTVRSNTAAAEGGGLWNNAGSEMRISGLTLSGNAANGAASDEGGGAVFNNGGRVIIDGSSINRNTATVGSGSGGGILSLGPLSIEDTTISNNTAARAGGGIEASNTSADAPATTTSLLDVRLEANGTGAAPGNGGALHVTHPNNVTVARSVLLRNTAASEGGGLWNNVGSSMRVDRATLSSNVANGDDADNGGGGIFNNGGELAVTRSTLATNRAPGASGSGGGIFSTGTLTVENTTLNANSASRAGGGIEASNTGASYASTTVRGSTLKSNTTGSAPGNGGAIHVTDQNDVLVLNSTVNANRAAAEGGGIWNNAGSSMRVIGSNIRDNVASGAAADQGGGGIFNNGGVLTINTSTLRRNTALVGSGSGGGVFNDGGTLTVRDTVVLENRAVRAGGGVEANAGSTELRRVDLRLNTTGSNPGNGGGLHLTGPGSVVIDASTVRSNDAANEGGGLWNSATGTMVVTGTTFTGNTAPTGPNVFNDGGTFTVDGTPVP